MPPLERDFLKYHKSIAAEMLAVKDRVRHLIGDRHWLTDGEHKEAILRRVLRNHAAQSLEIGRGFVCARDETSRQIDVLVAFRNKPALFRDGETLLVTPDAVSAVVEVKSQLSGAEFDEALEKVADDIQVIRAAGNTACVAGLFVFESLRHNSAHRRILSSVQRACRGEADRIVNWIAAGPDLFVRFWADAAAVNGDVGQPVWHSYHLTDLSHAYFISNVVWDACPNLDRRMHYAWFPVEGGKELHRQSYIGLNDDTPHNFNQ